MGPINKNVTVREQAILAKQAAKHVAVLSTEEKNEALYRLASTLETHAEMLLKENEKDLKNGRKQELNNAFLDRLALSKERIAQFTDGLRQVAELEDPVGKVMMDSRLDNGLNITKMSVPLGVIGMIYEARPNVTVDAAGLALKAGNAIVLKGGSSAIHSNKAIVSVMHKALTETNIPKEAIQLIESTNREASQQLFTMKEHIDVLIPRGGAGLINTVASNATVPVLETGIGNCHLYIDAEADLEKTLSILVNGKTSRPAVCNAIETALVHEKWLAEHHEALARTFSVHSITVHADEAALEVVPNAVAAVEEDWANEYLNLHIAIKVVKDVDEAIAHIEQYGTKHSEAILTENEHTAQHFIKFVDASAIYHNASTRFTDGGALGLGAEIGISTQKLHARGPMGLPALTTYKYIMTGDGQIRS
ncbi:glutamate-5-semialdehyde dehydrogenase [Neobacillus mesonae]|uniref:glutamate-5-semialdehyde dehydrogenase n=1 Tax=Neobacillus mesonae TaxID=1193713 RepID=UPI002573C23E|nr:glutamate-5-semialdehyde dehydrogenase [Neobacillus mesonae]